MRYGYDLLPMAALAGHCSCHHPVDVFCHQALAALVSANLLDRLDSMGQTYGLPVLVRQFFGIQRQIWPWQESFYRQRLAVISQVLASAHEGDGVAAAVNYWRQDSTARIQRLLLQYLVYDII